MEDILKQILEKLNSTDTDLNSRLDRIETKLQLLWERVECVL